MTLNNLHDEVCALAFEDGITIDKSFIASANRALMTIFTERPVAKTVRLYTKEQKPLIYKDTIIHRGGIEQTLKLCGRSYIFRVSGKGRFTISDGIAKTERSFDGDGIVFRGFIRSADATLTLSGEYTYTVYGFTCYGELYSEKESDIREYTQSSSYDINQLFGDFHSFLELPKTKDGTVTDAVMQNGILMLPFGKYDEVYLTYARMPRRISADEPDSEIDISGECRPLLPLLTTAYLWLDDDAEKAQYYMSLYKSDMSFIRRYNTSISGGEYRDVLGWA